MGSGSSKTHSRSSFKRTVYHRNMARRSSPKAERDYNESKLSFKKFFFKANIYFN